MKTDINCHQNEIGMQVILQQEHDETHLVLNEVVDKQNYRKIQGKVNKYLFSQVVLES